ncbi:hypothetical protein D3C78_1204940 [compost metagenome]
MLRRTRPSAHLQALSSRLPSSSSRSSRSNGRRRPGCACQSMSRCSPWISRSMSHRLGNSSAQSKCAPGSASPTKRARPSSRARRWSICSRCSCSSRRSSGWARTSSRSARLINTASGVFNAWPRLPRALRERRRFSSVYCNRWLIWSTSDTSSSGTWLSSWLRWPSCNWAICWRTCSSGRSARRTARRWRKRISSSASPPTPRPIQRRRSRRCRTGP